jgi:hypothetical protein
MRSLRPSPIATGKSWRPRLLAQPKDGSPRAAPSHFLFLPVGPLFRQNLCDPVTIDRHCPPVARPPQNRVAAIEVRTAADPISDRPGRDGTRRIDHPETRRARSYSVFGLQPPAVSKPSAAFAIVPQCSLSPAAWAIGAVSSPAAPRGLATRKPTSGTCSPASRRVDEGLLHAACPRHRADGHKAGARAPAPEGKAAPQPLADRRCRERPETRSRSWPPQLIETRRSL